MPRILDIHVAVLAASALFAVAPDEADDRYQFIVGLCDKGMHDLAVKEAEAFLRQHPRHEKAALARYRLASAQYQLGKLDAALPHFKDLSGRDGFEFRAEAFLRLGQCELAAERYPAARDAFAKALGAGKPYLVPAATFLLGESAFRMGDWAEAEKRYAEVMAKEPQGEYGKDAEYGLAWCAFREKKNDVAVERIRRFLARHPDDALAPELLFLAGEAHLDAGRPKEALEAYRAVKGGPFEDAALRGAAFSRAALGDRAGAAKDFGALIEKFPKSRFAAEAALQRGVQLLEAGDARSAAEALAHPAAGETPEVLYWRGRARGKAGDREGALADLDRALAGKPEAALAERIQSVRGDVLTDLGRTGEAALAYEKSGSAYAIQAAAVASLNDGKPADAVRHAKKLLAQHPESPYRVPALLALGEGLLAQKNAAEAEAAFREAAQAGPDADTRSRALSRAAWCRYLQNDFAAAGAEFAAVAREFPKSAEAEEAVFMAVRSFESAGDRESTARAGERYLKAFADGPHRADVLLALARIEAGEAGIPRLEALLSDGGGGGGEHAPVALYELAERHYKAGRKDEAERRYRAVVESHGASAFAPAARYGLGFCLYDAGKFADAAAALDAVVSDGKAEAGLRESALELSIFALARAGDAPGALARYRKFAEPGVDEGRRLEALRAVTVALKAQGALESARPFLEALARDAKTAPVRAGARIELAYAALERKNPDEAEAAVREAMRLEPKGPVIAEALFFVGEARFEAGDDARAADLYRSAAACEGSAVADKALYKEGFARLRKGDAEGASRAFAALVEKHPKSDLRGEGLFLLGESLYRLDRLEESAAAFERLQKEIPKHETMPKALFRRGVALGRLERWPEADAALGELASRHPNFENGAEAELWRGRALAAMKNPRGARQAFDRVIARDRGVLAARARLEIGRLHFAAGETDAALSEFLKVAVLYAHGEEVAEGLFLAAKCLESQGDPARARNQYQEIVEKHSKTAFADAARARLRELSSSQ